MRPIKFRAWDPDAKKMFYNCVVGGSVVIAEHGGSVVDGDFEPRYFTTNNAIAGFKVMQFTGLTDKNGKEIYEGDVVSVEYGRGKVIFHAGCFMIEWIDDPEANMELLSMRNAKFGHAREDLELLGNIYENPELLKKEAHP